MLIVVAGVGPPACSRRTPRRGGRPGPRVEDRDGEGHAGDEHNGDISPTLLAADMHP